MKKIQNDKKIYFELMRILACGLVIFNHLRGYSLYSMSSGIKQFGYMCLTMFTRVNVPLFFMISGALLLKKDENIVLILKKRILRIVLVLFLFEGIIMTVYKIIAIKSGQEFEYTIIRYLYGVFGKNLSGTGAYWYLYAYLGFLFMLPFMQRMAKGFTKAEFFMLLSVHFVVSSLIPIWNIIGNTLGLQPVQLCGDFQIPFALTKAFFYPLIGYYLEYNIDARKLRGGGNNSPDINWLRWNFAVKFVYVL